MANFTAGAVLTASALNTAFNTATINAQTTGYTIGTADAGELVTVNNNSGGTVTIPANTTWGAATGTIVSVLNAGTAGSWTIGTAAGVTLNASSASLAPLESGQLVKTATNTWYFTKGGENSTRGLYLITPTSIANASGSATASGGAVTFSAVSSVSLNGVFSTTHDAYRIVVRMTGSAAGADMTYRNRLAGSDAATNYNWQYLKAANTTVSAGLNAAQTSAYVGTYRSAGQAESWIDIYGASLAAETGIFSTNRDRDGGVSIGIFSGLHTAGTAYDGFTLSASTGTITGTVRVYGYKN